jgi:predicted MFS family arabinose efflux permease
VGGDHLVALMVGEAVVAVAAAAAFLVVRRSSPAPVPMVSGEPGELRAVWTDPVLRRVAQLAFLGFGVFIGLVTWLQALLEPRGVSESQAGTIITVAVAVGAVGSMVVAAVFEDRGVEVLLLRLALVAAVVGCALLAVATGVAVATIGAVLAVLALLTALPWLLSLCERRADDSVASATALLWLAGNLGGLLVAVVVGALVDYPAAAFLLMAAVALGALPLVRGRALGLES